MLLLCPAILFAQKKKVRHDPVYDKKPIHFGFTVGLNTMDFNVTQSDKFHDSLYADVSRLSPGFNVGIVSSFKLNEYFDLRILPGITFGERTLSYYTYDTITLKTIGFSKDQSIPSYFMEFPMIIKYKSKRINNFRPYLVGGANYRIDLAARKEYDYKDKVFLRLRRSDIYYEVGFGIDFYNKYFKFSAELKLAVGMRDVLFHDSGGDKDPTPSEPQYLLAIDRLQSNLWLLSFHFE